MAVMRSKSGFTLLEVLVALTILSMALGVLYQIFGTSLRSETEAERESEAVWVALSLLARVGTDLPAETGQISGDAGHSFAWALSMSPMTAPASAPVLPIDVMATVAWTSGGVQHSVTLHSTRLVPTMAQP
jgi:general secretion pathway protein I